MFGDFSMKKAYTFYVSVVAYAVPVFFVTLLLLKSGPKMSKNDGQEKLNIH